MKCPDCGETEAQQRLTPGAEQNVSYRCSQCGRLYSLPANIADLAQSITAMKAKVQALELEAGALARQLSAAEDRLLELREEHE